MPPISNTTSGQALILPSDLTVLVTMILTSLFWVAAVSAHLAVQHGAAANIGKGGHVKEGESYQESAEDMLISIFVGLWT